MAGLHFDITGDNSNFLRKLEEAQRGIRATSQQIEKEGVGIEALFGRMAKGAAAFGLGFSATQLIRDMIRVRGEFQQLDVAFTTLLQSKEKANALMAQMVKTAAETPFSLTEVATGARQLIAYGFEAEQVNNTLIRLGNIASGLGLPLERLTYLYGTTMTQGRLYARDLMQFTTSGIPMLQGLADMYGVTTDKVNEMVSAGKIGFPEVKKVIENLTNEGGKFFNLMQEQSKTITGKISNLGDAWDEMLNKIGKSQEGVINGSIDGLKYLVENYEAVGREIMSLVVSYGAYKAVLITVSAYQSAITGISYANEIAELSKLIPVKEKSVHADLEQAVASGKLSQSKAEQVSAMRVEAAAYAESLRLKALEVKAQYNEAMSTAGNAAASLEAAEMEVVAANMKYNAAIKSGNAKAIETAETKLAIAESNRYSASKVLEAARNNVTTTSTNYATASKAAETAVTTINTASQSANTRTTNLLTIAKTRLAAASKALGLSMLANPYVLVSAAVAGLVYGIYKLTTYQSEAEKAQIRLNDALRESASFALSEQRELARLKGELSTLTKGTDEYNTVKNKIVSQFGKYYAGLDEEITKVGLTEEAYNKLTLAINKSFGVRQYEKFASEQQEELSNIMADNLEKIQERLYSELGDEAGAKIYAKIRESIIQGSLTIGENGLNIQGLGSEIKSALDKVAGKDGGFLDVTNRSVERYISNIIIATKRTDELNDKARKRFGIENTNGSNKKDEKNNEEGGGKKSTYQEDLAKAKADWEKAKKGYEVLLKDQNATSEQVKNARDDMQAKEKAYKNLGGITGNSLTKRENEAEKLRKEQQKSFEELLSLRRQNQQDEIDLMEEGAEKRLKQIELDYQKELDAIRKKEQEWSKANGGKLTEEQSVQISLSYSQAEDKRDKSISEMNKEEFEAMNRYLKEYGTFQQRKDAITKEYSNKIAKAATEGDKKILQKEMEESLSSLNMDKLKQEINWELIFGDLSKVSKRSLEQVKQQLKVFKNSDEYKNMTVDQKKVIDEALNNIQSTIIDKGGLLGNLPEQLDALRIAQEELNQAQEEYNDAIKHGTDAEKEAALKKKNNAEKNVQNAEVNVTKSTDKTKQNLITLADTITQLGSSSEISLSQIGSLASGLVDVFTEAGSKIGGIVGAAFSLLDAIGKQGLDGFVENVFSSVFKASTGIWDTITFGAFSKITGSGDSDKNLEKDIEYLAQSNQDLKNSLDNLSEKMDKASVADASDIYSVQRENILKQEANTRESMQRSASASSNGFLGIGGSHSTNYKINKGMSSSEWKRVSEIVGRSVQNASQFFKLSSEQMAKLAEEDTTLYSKIKSLADDGYKNAAQFMDEYITYYKQLEELENAYNEKLTNTSFDSIRNDFKSALLDMESDAEDFADNFEKMMQNAIVESLMTKKYDSLIQAWYNDFAKAMEGDGKIDEYEQRNLQNRWDSITNQALAERDALKDAMGWESDSKSTSQSSTSKGFQTMSQDTGNELNGRFTALQISNEEIKNAMLSMLVYVNLISVSVNNNSITLMEIKNLMVTSNGYLEDISGHTKKMLADFGAKLDSINKNIEKAI